MTEKKPYVIWLDNVDVSNIIYYMFQYENGGDQFNEFTKIPEPARAKFQKLITDFYQVIQNIDFTDSVFAEELRVDDGNKALVKLLEAKSRKFLLQTQSNAEKTSLYEFLAWLKKNPDSSL